MSDDAKAGYTEHGAQLFVRGREFEIGPSEEGGEFDLRDQLVIARIMLDHDLNRLRGGIRMDWMQDDDEISAEIELIESQRSLIGQLLSQVVRPGIKTRAKEDTQHTSVFDTEPDEVNYPTPGSGE